MDIREKLMHIFTSEPEMLKNLNVSTIKLYRLVDKLISHGVTVRDNAEISDELLEQLRNAHLTVLHEEPTIEVVHGRWIVKGQEVFCSHCDKESGYNHWGASAFSNYCPNCGAKMDLEEQNV